KMICRVLIAALLGASIVLSASDPSTSISSDSIGESVDAPPQSITVDEEQPAAAFQDDQQPTHVAGGGMNGSTAIGGMMPGEERRMEGVTGQPSVTEYKFSSDRNTTDSSMAASAFTAFAAVSLTILL
ncbi:hypothetical protein PENTCL1PPCAC_5848, partial [Pristionchus entomophagus]